MKLVIIFLVVLAAVAIVEAGKTNYRKLTLKLQLKQFLT